MLPFIVIIILAYSNALSFVISNCPYLYPTHDFDEEAVLGMWYIREIIFHEDKEIKTVFYPYCPIVQIRKLEDYVSGGLINRNLVSYNVL